MDKTIYLKDGGSFTYVITNRNLKPDPNGNTMYIISINAGIDDNGENIRGTHVTERVLNYIIEKFPNIYYVKSFPTKKEHSKIFGKAFYKTLNIVPEIRFGQSFTIKIR